jgi:crossover junction endodeoxyribonuclease RuvC
MPETKSQIILGIDPGLADTGFGIIESKNGTLKSLGHGSIQTSKKLKLTQRLELIEIELNEIIKKFQPDIAAIEKLFFGRNVTTAITVGQARGVVLLGLAKQKIPTIEFTPLQVKQAVTGYGGADKRQVQEMVKLILKLDQIPKPDDAADALAVAIGGANSNPQLIQSV